MHNELVLNCIDLNIAEARVGRPHGPFDQICSGVENCLPCDHDWIITLWFWSIIVINQQRL